MTYNIFKVRNKNGNLRLGYSGGVLHEKGSFERAEASYNNSIRPYATVVNGTERTTTTVVVRTLLS
jgi:hypothetical protein